MSREIKFRVWSEDQKTYNYKFPYNSIGDFYVNTRGKVFSDFGNSVAPEVRQEAFVIEQSTGLKDKNGKEIYEGDIVNIQGIKYYVDFEHGGFWFNNDNRKWKANRPFTHFQEINDAEVIGTIHENPELLEDKK